MKEFLFEILANEKVVFVMLALVLCAFTELIKLPYKKITEKIASKCKKEENRKYLKSLLNGIIAFIPLGFGVLGEYIVCIVSHETFDMEKVRIGLECGSTTILGYLGMERVFLKKKKTGIDTTALNMYDTKEAEDVKSIAGEIIKDGKIDSSDLPAVKDFLDKFGKK